MLGIEPDEIQIGVSTTPFRRQGARKNLYDLDVSADFRGYGADQVSQPPTGGTTDEYRGGVLLSNYFGERGDVPGRRFGLVRHRRDDFTDNFKPVLLGVVAEGGVVHNQFSAVARD